MPYHHYQNHQNTSDHFLLGHQLPEHGSLSRGGEGRGGKEEDDLQKRQGNITVNAGLELNLDIEIQLQPQLQALLVHDTLVAGFGVDRFRRRRAEGLVRAAVTHGDLTAHGARVGDRAVHGGRVGACAEVDEYGNHDVHRGAVRTGGWM
jgi:hypothetical protein